MKNIKQIEMGALYLDGAAQINPAYLEAGTIPEYQSGAKISIGEIPADHSECTITWNEVRLTNEQTLLIADRVLLNKVSYDDIEAAGFVEGQKVTLDGKDYLCRLLRCDKDNHEKDEWAMALDVVGEDDELWHWQNAASWVIAPTDTLPLDSLRLGRGAYSARSFDWDSSDFRNAYLGFRPCLEPVEPVDSPSDERGLKHMRLAQQRILSSVGSLRDEAKDCEFCKGVFRTAFAANVRRLMPDDTVRDIAVPTRFCPACGKALKQIQQCEGHTSE